MPTPDQRKTGGVSALERAGKMRRQKSSGTSIKKEGGGDR